MEGPPSNKQQYRLSKRKKSEWKEKRISHDDERVNKKGAKRN